jgi:hypothetical protein
VLGATSSFARLIQIRTQFFNFILRLGTYLWYLPLTVSLYTVPSGSLRVITMSKMSCEALQSEPGSMVVRISNLKGPSTRSEKYAFASLERFVAFIFSQYSTTSPIRFPPRTRKTAAACGYAKDGADDYLCDRWFCNGFAPVRGKPYRD